MNTKFILGNTVDTLFESGDLGLEVIKKYYIQNSIDEVYSFIKRGLERHSINTSKQLNWHKCNRKAIDLYKNEALKLRIEVPNNLI